MKSPFTQLERDTNTEKERPNLQDVVISLQTKVTIEGETPNSFLDWTTEEMEMKVSNPEDRDERLGSHKAEVAMLEQDDLGQSCV